MAPHPVPLYDLWPLPRFWLALDLWSISCLFVLPFALYRSSFKSNLHHTSHTGRHQSREKWLVLGEVDQRSTNIYSRLQKVWCFWSYAKLSPIPVRYLGNSERYESLVMRCARCTLMLTGTNLIQSFSTVHSSKLMEHKSLLCSVNSVSCEHWTCVISQIMTSHFLPCIFSSQQFCPPKL